MLARAYAKAHAINTAAALNTARAATAAAAAPTAAAAAAVISARSAGANATGLAPPLPPLVTVAGAVPCGHLPLLATPELPLLPLAPAVLRLLVTPPRAAAAALARHQPCAALALCSATPHLCESPPILAIPLTCVRPATATPPSIVSAG